MILSGSYDGDKMEKNCGGKRKMKTKRIVLVVTAILLSISGLTMAYSAAPEDLSTFAYEDEDARYWTVETPYGYHLTGAHKSALSGEQVIMKRVLGIAVQDGYLIVFGDDSSNVNDKANIVEYVVAWERDPSRDAMVAQLKQIDPVHRSLSDIPVFFDALVKAGNYNTAEEEPESIFVASAYRGRTLYLWTIPGWSRYARQTQIGNYTAAEFHPLGFFYFFDAKGSMAALAVEDIPENTFRVNLKVEEKLLKGTFPVAGKTYLGWLNGKGFPAYTLDGKIVETLVNFPKGTEFEFYEGFIVAKYEDYWLAKILPGQAPVSIAETEYAGIVKSMEMLNIQMQD